MTTIYQSTRGKRLGYQRGGTTSIASYPVIWGYGASVTLGEDTSGYRNSSNMIPESSSTRIARPLSKERAARNVDTRSHKRRRTDPATIPQERGDWRKDTFHPAGTVKVFGVVDATCHGITCGGRDDARKISMQLHRWLAESDTNQRCHRCAHKLRGIANEAALDGERKDMVRA